MGKLTKDETSQKGSKNPQPDSLGDYSIVKDLFADGYQPAASFAEALKLVNFTSRCFRFRRSMGPISVSGCRHCER